jgi:hypothetical protein
MDPVSDDHGWELIVPISYVWSMNQHRSSDAVRILGAIMTVVPSVVVLRHSKFVLHCFPLCRGTLCDAIDPIHVVTVQLLVTVSREKV